MHSFIEGLRQIVPQQSKMELDLEDDGATLEAALALIDEWELELDEIPLPPPSLHKSDSDASSQTATGTDSDDTSSSSSSPPSATAPPAKPSKRRKQRSDEESATTASFPPAQMQRREELIFLRQKVRELESQLAAMHEENTAATQKSEPQTSRELSAAWVWQQIASRQLKHRQKSEQENLRLRVMVEEQLKVAKDLMRVLMRAYQRSQDQHSDATGSNKRIKVPKDGLGEVSLELQLARVDELRHDSDAVFSSAPFSTAEPVFRKIDLVEHANGETTINVDCAWVLPFSVEMVAHSFWRYLVKKTSCPAQGCDWDTWEPYINDNSDTISAPYQSNALAERMVGTFVGQYAARRFRLGDGGKHEQLIITDMRAAPTDFKPLSMEGVRLHTEIMVRFVWDDRDDAESTASTTRMCKIQVSHRIHIRFAAAETPTRRRRADALANYMFYTVEGELGWKQDVLENLLLQATSSNVPMLSSITELQDHE